MAHFKSMESWHGPSLRERLRQAVRTMRAIANRLAAAARRMMRWTFVSASMAGLAACATPDVKGLCPSYVHYQKYDDQFVRNELRVAGVTGQSLPMTHRFLRDYGKQRAALRVICKGN
ncbi:MULTISPECIES: hypothetical protein [unclassified Saccharibacter]|uniref:hypothetical protein n=1 Tax=unclassified Saccharibacter TaxID=2648722 RepID=UPI001325610A|nr:MULTISPECIES: hypothetical protein [unclassified Saccharibacter]MXV35829.1 hypothetical protein [Saccharibacter sp. EH611]MXV57950.1 hypothetical protein [Saccharibacter sp. EH70]MXV66345.1 hypothetical protein [Saccharibacter sp. EH60]